MDNIEAKIFALLLSLPAFIAGLTIHEFAHAWTADRLGDDTPRRMGRVTLDPMAHLDPFGSIMFVVTRFLGWGVGWAKPVPVNPRNFQHPQRDDILVSVAGPVSNLLQLPFWLGALWILRTVGASQGYHFDYQTIYDVVLGDANLRSGWDIAATILSAGVWVNVLFAAFNMIPIPPLDGHWILQALYPPIRPFYEMIYPYAFFLVFMISKTGVFSYIIAPPFWWAVDTCVRILSPI